MPEAEAGGSSVRRDDGTGCNYLPAGSRSCRGLSWLHSPFFRLGYIPSGERMSTARRHTQDSCIVWSPLWGVAFLKNPVLGEGTGENKCCILEIVLHHGPERDPTPRSTFRCCGSHWRVPPPRCPRTMQTPRTGTPAGHGHPFRI